LNLADALWVPSQFARRCLEPFFFGPVHVIPHPVRLTSSQARTFPGVPDDMFLFVSVLQWSDRKNPDGLLKAFVRAFRGRRDVGLLLKLGWRVGDANIESAMRTVFLETLGIGRLRAPPVFVVNEEVGRQAMDVLFARADAYVSLHRSEGFGLTLADAMAAEVPVIATGHSGNLDFMDAASAMLVRHRMVPVRQRLVRTWFDGSMTWAEPDLDHAVELMRALVAQPGASATMAANGARRVREQLSPARIGRLMRDHCDG
jgi:glycosyltransferase involved in cell wall biosynthesis